MAVSEQNLPQKFEDLSAEKQLELIKKQNIAALGDGEVFLKRTGDGIFRAIKAPVRLEESNGEIAVIQGKGMTTGKGFYHANQIAGLSIITPEKLTLPDGQVVVNPFPIIDPESQTIRKFWVKKLALGFSPVGNLVITTATLLYDINMYFIQDLIKKIKDNAAAGRVCMEQTLTDDEKRKGIFYKIDGFMGVWADMSHKDILKCVETFVNKKQFAERNAQTIAERLVMGKHPALSHIAYVTPVGPEKHRTATVTVYGYVHDFTQTQLLEMAEQAERGEEIKVNGQTVEVIETVAEASDVDISVDADDEERMAAAQSAAAEQDAPPPVNPLGGELY